MSENEKKERYLFISCAGSGYQNEIAEFLKTIYIKNGEYYDHLQVVGSVYPMLFNSRKHYIDYEESVLNLFLSLRENLLNSIYYLIIKHNLTKTVVVSESECALYKDISDFKSIEYNEFVPQKRSFSEALERLNSILTNSSDKLNLSVYLKFEAWYMNVRETENYKDIIFDNMSGTRSIRYYFNSF